MPTYEFKCENCKKRFRFMMSIADRSSKRLKCPKCDSRKIQQQYSAVYTVTSKKS